MKQHQQKEQAQSYARFLHGMQNPLGAAEGSPDSRGGSSLQSPAPSAKQEEIELYWGAGLLGTSGQSRHHGYIEILDFGEWNRNAGPDYLNCSLLLAGSPVHGDVVITHRATDWEKLGFSLDERYNKVVLHICLQAAPTHWFTRTANHRDVPVLQIEPEAWRLITKQSQALTPEEHMAIPAPLGGLPYAAILSLLQSAAAHRMRRKRESFERKAATLGASQAWFEAWAETLGYQHNRLAMKILARRASLQKLRASPAEALLLGIAGFLRPVLPERASDETRAYHRRVWDSWWPIRDEHELTEPRQLPWVFGSSRPANHPHRRVAALAASAAVWEELEANFSVSRLKQLESTVAQLEHNYWSTHSCLPSAQLSKKIALIGSERLRGFIINHLLVVDDTPQAWDFYLKQKESSQIPSKIERIAKQLFGEREELSPLLRASFVQQALLQIHADFNLKGTCAFPQGMADWH